MKHEHEHYALVVNHDLPHPGGSNEKEITTYHKRGNYESTLGGIQRRIRLKSKNNDEEELGKK